MSGSGGELDLNRLKQAVGLPPQVCSIIDQIFVFPQGFPGE
jgi:hypothetical protein